MYGRSKRLDICVNDESHNTKARGESILEQGLEQLKAALLSHVGQRDISLLALTDLDGNLFTIILFKVHMLHFQTGWPAISNNNERIG